MADDCAVAISINPMFSLLMEGLCSQLGSAVESELLTAEEAMEIASEFAEEKLPAYVQFRDK